MLSASAREDARLSRRHASVTLRGGRWSVRDLESRNGTFVNGARIEGEWSGAGQPRVRVGNTLLLLAPDIQPFADARIETRRDAIAGPGLAKAWRAIAQAARGSRVVHLTGETGSGKEVAARHFHESGPQASGPLVSINCAAIPASLAERLLFGVKKGAFSGAEADADGYLQSADNGTLFLDEVGELDLAVQAKLLRALETKEVLPLGATRPRKVSFALCTATLASLEARVQQGRFRSDLYFRIGRPTVEIPPLRSRPEEIPWLIAHALRGKPLRVSASFAEAALLRSWPGNLRELLAAVRSAEELVESEGGTVLRRQHLASEGRLGAHEDGIAPEVQAPLSQAAVMEALARHQNNVSAAARALGLHRTQLRRMLARWNG
jgi:transcriptional regulator with PAS, ATPase and Fis domain